MKLSYCLRLKSIELGGSGMCCVKAQSCRSHWLQCYLGFYLLLSKNSLSYYVGDIHLHGSIQHNESSYQLLPFKSFKATINLQSSLKTEEEVYKFESLKLVRLYYIMYFHQIFSSLHWVQRCDLYKKPQTNSELVWLNLFHPGHVKMIYIDYVSLAQ